MIIPTEPIGSIPRPPELTAACAGAALRPGRCARKAATAAPAPAAAIPGDGR